MPLILVDMCFNRFKDLMSKKTDKAEFLEREGRFMFICFLKPIIDGTGFYYSEPEQQTFFSSFCETLQAKSETIFCKNSANFAS